MDILASPNDVRFAPESGHARCKDTLSDDPKLVGCDSLVKATGRSLLHLKSVDGQLGIVRVRTRFDGWSRNVARRCTSTGVGGGIYLRGRYSFDRSLRG